MKKKKIVTALLIPLICLTLGACKDKGPKEPDWDANTLVFAHTYASDNEYQKLLKGFSAAHPDLQFEIRDYTDEGGTDRLLTEILAGNVPDIIELRGIPYDRMAQLGYLEDLWPYIENGPDIGRENVMEAPLKAAEVDGKLYTVFRSATLRTLIGPKRLVGDRTSWTVEDMLKAFSKMPQGSTITDYYMTKYGIFELIFSLSLDGYVDWGKGKCSFDSDSFRSALEFVNCFPDEFDWTVDTDLEELSSRRRDGLQMLWLLGIQNPAQISDLENVQFGEPISYVGYPIGDGSVGSCFAPSSRYAMSSTCRQKEAAWDILRKTLLPEYTFQTMKNALEADSYKVGFPVNRPDYEMLMRVCTAKNGYHGRTARGELPSLTEEQMMRFEDFYNQIDKISSINRDIYDIVWEQSGAYFAGDKTEDETIKLIERRVNLYLGENL